MPSEFAMASTACTQGARTNWVPIRQPMVTQRKRLTEGPDSGSWSHAGEKQRCELVANKLVVFVCWPKKGVPNSYFSMTWAEVQVTVPEGRCRHCQRGQRQTLAPRQDIAVTSWSRAEREVWLRGCWLLLIGLLGWLALMGLLGLKIWSARSSRPAVLEVVIPLSGASLQAPWHDQGMWPCAR